MKEEIVENAIRTAKIKWSEINHRLNPLSGRFFVYILTKNNFAIYVGRSYNLGCRLYTHKYSKDFDSIYLLEYSTYKECCLSEKKITKHLKPIHNRLWVLFGNN